MLYTVKLSDEQLAQDIQEANTNDLLNSVGLGKWTLTELKEATPAELPLASFKEKVTCLTFLELGKRVERSNPEKTERVMGSLKFGKRMALKMKDLKQEHLVVVLLNTQNEIIKEITVFKGTVTKSMAEPREILHHAIKHLATSVILVHNHPSGSTYPSRDDDETTKHIKEACDLMGITLLDHLIVGGLEYYSYREQTDII